MQVGDKVAMIHGNIKGVITKIISDKIMEVEDEYGFQRRVQKSEFVLISPYEVSNTDKADNEKITQSAKASEAKKSSAPVALHGIYLALNDEGELFVINHTDVTLMLSVYACQGAGVVHVFGGAVPAKNKQPLFRKSHTCDGLHIQCIKYINGSKVLLPMMEQRVEVAQLKRKCNKQMLSYFNHEVYAMQVDAEWSQINTGALQQYMLDGRATEHIHVIEAVPTSIDLHEEALLGKNHGLSASEIFEYQKQAFLKYLDSALAAGHEKVTIIHGAGNGRLRNFVHHTLRSSKFVKRFNLVDEHVYGSGVTEAIMA